MPQLCLHSVTALWVGLKLVTLGFIWSQALQSFSQVQFLGVLEGTELRSVFKRWFSIGTVALPAPFCSMLQLLMWQGLSCVVRNGAASPAVWPPRALGCSRGETELHHGHWEQPQLNAASGHGTAGTCKAQDGEVERAAGSCASRPCVSWSPSAAETSQPFLHPTMVFLLRFQNVPCMLCVPEKWKKIKSAISTLQRDN